MKIVALPLKDADPLSPAQTPGASLAIGECVRAIENSLLTQAPSRQTYTLKSLRSVPAWMLTHLEARTKQQN